VWAIAGADQAKKREELLLAALEDYRAQLASQHAILEKLSQLPLCQRVIEEAPKLAPGVGCQTAPNCLPAIGVEELTTAGGIRSP
jgi:hypothetical protein